MGLADGMSHMPLRYNTHAFVKDAERLAIVIVRKEVQNMNSDSEKSGSEVISQRTHMMYQKLKWYG